MDKLRALPHLAGQGQGRRSGQAVTGEDIRNATGAGASDLEIHDTVLIAAAFCVYNRYVDGLAALTPEDPALYDLAAERITAHGYLSPDDRH